MSDKELQEKSENVDTSLEERAEIDPGVLVSVKLETPDVEMSLGEAGEDNKQPVDITTLCRLCAKKCPSDTGINLAPPPVQIAAYIEQFFGIQLAEGDGMPTQMCDTCHEDINHWVTFCRTVEDAQLFLKQHTTLPDPFSEQPDPEVTEGGSMESTEHKVSMDEPPEMLEVECDNHLYDDMENSDSEQQEQDQIHHSILSYTNDFPQQPIECTDPNRKKWRKEQRMNSLLRAQGKAYLGFRKIGDKTVLVPRKAREMGPRCGFFCQRSVFRYCNEMSDAEREATYRQFWNMTWAEKKLFVRGHTQEFEPQRKTKNPKSKNREKFLRYYLTIGGEPRRVCQHFFLSTLAMGQSQLNCWLKNKQDEQTEDLQKKKRKEILYRQKRARIDTTQGRMLLAKEFASTALDNMPRRPTEMDPKSKQCFGSIRAIHRYCSQKAKDCGVNTISWPCFFELFHAKKLLITDLMKEPNCLHYDNIEPTNHLVVPPPSHQAHSDHPLPSLVPPMFPMLPLHPDFPETPMEPRHSGDLMDPMQPMNPSVGMEQPINPEHPMNPEHSMNPEHPMNPEQSANQQKPLTPERPRPRGSTRSMAPSRRPMHPEQPVQPEQPISQQPITEQAMHGQPMHPMQHMQAMQVPHESMMQSHHEPHMLHQELPMQHHMQPHMMQPMPTHYTDS